MDRELPLRTCALHRYCARRPPVVHRCLDGDCCRYGCYDKLLSEHGCQELRLFDSSINILICQSHVKLNKYDASNEKTREVCDHSFRAFLFHTLQQSLSVLMCAHSHTHTPCQGHFFVIKRMPLTRILSSPLPNSIFSMSTSFAKMMFQTSSPHILVADSASPSRTKHFTSGSSPTCKTFAQNVS